MKFFIILSSCRFLTVSLLIIKGMCGICGVIGPNAAEKAFEGLKNLEYRGYDSWGLAMPENGGFYLEKHVGKIGDSKLSISSAPSIALGHTRWATHGKVTEKNAHPHLSQNGKIAIVHNGIVENFEELKKNLVLKGYRFVSETDSEVIANLIEEKMVSGNDFAKAVRLAILELEGNYAIVALHLGENKLVCARNGSPLVMGIGNGEYFAASDATAFINRTNKAVFLDDQKMAVLSENFGILVFDLKSGKEEKTQIKELQWTFEQAKKGSYEHFMIKEISEQPNSMIASTEQPSENLGKFINLAKTSQKILFLGCGSSYHASLSASRFFSEIAKLDSRVFIASEFDLHSNFVDKNTLIIAVSQSGETADLLEAVKMAKQKGAAVACIVNVMDSSLMRISDCTLLMNAGPEICVLSTKSYTSQLALFFYISMCIAGKEKEAKNEISKACTIISGIISGQDGKLRKIASELRQKSDIFVIGRGAMYPSAMESALKIKEVSYIHAEGFAGGELKHGTIALIENGVPAIVLCDNDSRKLSLSNAIEMKSRGAMILGVDSENNEIYDHFIEVPDIGALNPAAKILPIQMLSYYLALERSLDPDKPRNLAKSVTVK